MSNSKSGNSSFLIILMVVLGVLAVGGYGAFRVMRHLANTQPSVVATQPSEDTNTTPTDNSPTTYVTTTPNAVVSPTVTSNSLSNGNSNADLDKDMQTISGKVNSANSANTDMNTSFTNQTQDSATNIQ